MGEPLKTTAFKPWAENQERLEIAKKMGINVSDVINEALEQCAKQIIEGKAKQLREALSVPVP